MQPIIQWMFSNIPLETLLIALIVGYVQAKRCLQPAAKTEAFIRAFLWIQVGITNIWNFIMHSFFGQIAAQFIGWAQSPFQFEVGVCSLGIGLAAFWASKKGYDAWMTVFLTYAGFLWGAAGGHIYQMIIQHNFAPGNAGMTFYMDLAVPALMLILLRKYQMTGR